MLAYITGSVDEELQRRNEYLVAENGILRSQLHERIRLAEIGRRLGGKALAEVAQIVSPETILAWDRRLVAMKFVIFSREEIPTAQEGQATRRRRHQNCPRRTHLWLRALGGRRFAPEECTCYKPSRISRWPVLHW